jgi:hypothetical protein
MKKLTLVLFLLTSTLSIAQTIDNPPKKTWKILIKNSNNKEVNFQLIGQTIIDNDFSIEKKDVDYLTMETTPKITEGQTSTFYLKLIAKDNLIILTGMGKSRVNVSLANIEDEYSKIKNIGMSGSVAKDQFKAMLNFAKLFSGNGNEFEFIVE